MAKTDRIPDQWPLLMSDETSARYFDVSVSLFHLWVKAGHVPEGHRVFTSTVVRWHREALDALMNREFGRLIAEGASAHDGEDAWDRALGAA
jgi:hypothetical protein